MNRLSQQRTPVERGKGLRVRRLKSGLAAVTMNIPPECAF
jgi:hypothetical protein